MAVCSWCKQEMTSKETLGCKINTVEIAGITYGSEPFWADEGERCHDCNALSGHYHHPGCDNERCPKCGGQLIGCGCLDEEEDDADQ